MLIGLLLVHCRAYQLDYSTIRQIIVPHGYFLTLCPHQTRIHPASLTRSIPHPNSPSRPSSWKNPDRCPRVRPIPRFPPATASTAWIWPFTMGRPSWGRSTGLADRVSTICGCNCWPGLVRRPVITTDDRDDTGTMMTRTTPMIAFSRIPWRKNRLFRWPIQELELVLCLESSPFCTYIYVCECVWCVQACVHIALLGVTLIITRFCLVICIVMYTIKKL